MENTSNCVCDMRIIPLDEVLNCKYPYKNICVFSIEPKVDYETMKYLGDKYFMEGIEHNGIEFIYIAGFPYRSNECYSNCINLLEELKNTFSDKIFVSGIYHGKLHNGVVDEAIKNKMLVDEILDEL